MIANAQIPMINIYDDHDIIDGFGSYPHKFMQCPVFSNLGRAAFKYYLIFQHQSTVEEGKFMGEWDKSIVFGTHPGPYIKELSRNFVTPLGKGILFLGIIKIWTTFLTFIKGADNRTERTRHKVNYDTTYRRIFNRLEQELAKGGIKHLIIMLGKSSPDEPLISRDPNCVSSTCVAGNDFNEPNHDADQVISKNGRFLRPRQ